MIEPESMAAPTGERFIPEVMGDSLIEAEHHVRYGFAADAANRRRVLDAGCGVGWGSLILHQAGAAAVAGLDIDADALADARRRSAAIAFIRGDLQALPFDDDQFDLVTCFEAIEHVADPWRALDELRRVLNPAGTLMVSSPNPRVYPPGNPFHVHEFEPEELLAALEERFAHAAVWLQHSHIAATLSQSGAAAADTTGRYRRGVELIGRASIETARYSLVVATDGDIVDQGGAVALVSSRQLDELEDTAAGMSAERAAYNEEHIRILEERQRLLSEHAILQADVQTLASENSSVHAEVKRLAAENSSVQAERDECRARLRVITHSLASTTADRDRVLLLLLDAEQELAQRSIFPATTTTD